MAIVFVAFHPREQIHATQTQCIDASTTQIATSDINPAVDPDVPGPECCRIRFWTSRMISLDLNGKAACRGRGLSPDFGVFLPSDLPRIFPRQNFQRNLLNLSGSFAATGTFSLAFQRVASPVIPMGDARRGSCERASKQKDEKRYEGKRAAAMREAMDARSRGEKLAHRTENNAAQFINTLGLAQRSQEQTVK